MPKQQVASVPTGVSLSNQLMIYSLRIVDEYLPERGRGQNRE